MATEKAAPEDRLRRQEVGGKTVRTAGRRQREKDRLDITVGESSLRKHMWVATAILKTEPSQSDQTRRHRPSRLDPGLTAGPPQPKTQSGLAFREDTYRGWVWGSHTTRLRLLFSGKGPLLFALDLSKRPSGREVLLLKKSRALRVREKKVKGNTGTKTLAPIPLPTIFP